VNGWLASTLVETQYHLAKGKDMRPCGVLPLLPILRLKNEGGGGWLQLSRTSSQSVADEMGLDPTPLLRKWGQTIAVGNQECKSSQRLLEEAFSCMELSSLDPAIPVVMTHLHKLKGGK
jgi:hypothetical protein